jgi:hypothetical protein
LVLSSSKGGGVEVNARHTLDRQVDVTLYIYDSKINGFDDIRGAQMSAYRDSGAILRMADARPALTQSYAPTYENMRDMRLITKSAGEVKRVNDCTVLYFFKHVNTLNIKSLRLRMIYNSLRGSIQNGNAVILRLDEHELGRC